VQFQQLNSIKSVATRAYELLSHRIENYKFKHCNWMISPEELSHYGMFESKKESMEEIFQLGYNEAEKTFLETF
jgi:NTE family protein